VCRAVRRPDSSRRTARAAGVQPTSATIRNAIESIHQAGRRGGIVRVEGRLRDVQSGRSQWIEIDVIDDGIGPPPLPKGSEHLAFEFGFSTKPGGLGVGLAMAKEILEQNDGMISLRGRDGEPGAMVSMRLPVTRDMKRQ
jgi:nitrogen fixation/metabolism regulation signal transduction histidine kinase